jgi:hypothetical protein
LLSFFYHYKKYIAICQDEILKKNSPLTRTCENGKVMATGSWMNPAEIGTGMFLNPYNLIWIMPT